MENGTPKGVLKIVDIVGRKVDNVVKPEKQPVDNAKAEMQTKIATAKVHAARELKEFREKTQAYVDYLRSTALFPSTGDLVEMMLIHQILESTIEPAITNQRMMGVPQEVFNTLRRDMFKALITKYIDNAGK